MRKSFLKHCVVFSVPAMAVLLNYACSPSFEGGYADPNSIQVIDDKWNDTDARVTAEKMIPSCLSFPWLGEHTGANNGAKPVLLVGDFENRTEEHIDTKALFEAVRTELMKSGRTRFVDGDSRKKLMDEYKYQNSGMVKSGTAKGPGNQTSADFFLNGNVSAVVNEQGGKKIVTYQVNMRLTNIKTSEIVWEESHKIKKQFKRKGAGV